MKVYATWIVPTLPDYINDIHISCGAAETQFPGFFMEDECSKLEIVSLKDGYQIDFECDSADLLTYDDWWLSPSLIEDVEACDFGLKEENYVVSVAK